MNTHDSGHSRRWSSAPMLVALLALLVATSGTTYAALTVTGKDVVNGTLTTKDVKNRSLLEKDFKKGQLTAGPQGPQGAPGLPGAKGDPGVNGKDGQDGAPDTPAQVLAKIVQADGSGSGLDADTLDGKTSAELVQGVASKAALALPPANFSTIDLWDGDVSLVITCGNPALVDPLQGNSEIRLWNNRQSVANVFIDNGGSTPLFAALTFDDRVIVPALPAGEMLIVHVQWGDGTFANFTVSSIHRASDCHVQASGVLLR